MDALKALLSAAHAVHAEAQVRFLLSPGDEDHVAVVVMVGNAEIFRTPVSAVELAIQAALTRLGSISTRISLAKVQSLLEQAKEGQEGGRG